MKGKRKTDINDNLSISFHIWPNGSPYTPTVVFALHFEDHWSKGVGWLLTGLKKKKKAEF